jgi:hypothetical protein
MIVVIGLLIAFVLVLILARRNMRGCRWRQTGQKQADGQALYRCAACGAQLATSTGRPPAHCELERHL